MNGIEQYLNVPKLGCFNNLDYRIEPPHHPRTGYEQFVQIYAERLATMIWP